MLPFLKPKDQRSAAGIIMKTRSPDEKPEGDQDHSAAIHEASSALIQAVHARDTEATAKALQDAFDILDSKPHEEGEHVEPHSYDSQKED